MSLFNTLNTGITGLGANGLGLSVSGDNIANLNTVGYKGSSAEFQDLIMQNLGGGKGQLGMGAFTGRVRQGFGQGSIETTANAADLAIDGKGFFVVEDADGGDFYSRAGQFTMNPEGELVTLGGLKLQGYTAAADGTLPTLRFGKRIVVPVAALEALARDAYQPNTNDSGREDAAE